MLKEYIQKLLCKENLSVANIESALKEIITGNNEAQIAAQALKHADGFVVGSAFANAISNGASPSDLKNLATEIDPR